MVKKKKNYEWMVLFGLVGGLGTLTMTTMYFISLTDLFSIFNIGVLIVFVFMIHDFNKKKDKKTEGN